MNKIRVPFGKNERHRLKQLTAMFFNNTLCKELDAMRMFLCTWKKEYEKERDPRMSLIVGMMEDICTIISLRELHLNHMKKGEKRKHLADA